MYAKGKAVNVGKEGLAAEFEKAMETAEGDDWHGFGANDVEGLFHAERWLYYMKGLIEVKSWDKSELKKAKKQNKQLLQKFNMAMKENKTMKEERAALQSLVSGKGIDSTKKPARAVLRILEPLMKVARESLAVDYSALEKQVERLGRQVSHREREVAVLLGKLRLRLSAEERLRDRKNRALREKRRQRSKW